jgi:nuclear pore complex protein Nup205
MSLLIQMSRKRPGAERLLESRIIPILAQCDYLDARPETDQAFMGTTPRSVPWWMSLILVIIDHDNLLPSAIQRYHQMFMPALQLINGILMSLGSNHTGATAQVC